MPKSKDRRALEEFPIAHLEPYDLAPEPHAKTEQKAGPVPARFLHGQIVARSESADDARQPRGGCKLHPCEG